MFWPCRMVYVHFPFAVTDGDGFGADQLQRTAAGCYRAKYDGGCLEAPAPDAHRPCAFLRWTKMKMMAVRRRLQNPPRKSI